jgi:hypothetical protein
LENILRELHRQFQIVLLLVQLPYQPILNILFRACGVQRYFMTRAARGAYVDLAARDDLLSRLLEAFKHSSTISIALGEMGHRLADNPALLRALESAYKNNQVVIRVLHGPRVDPETREIFELARQGVIQLKMTPHYSRRHFFIVRLRDGRISILDEGVHNEALWEQDENSHPKKVYSSRYRIYYYHRYSKGLAEKLIRIFEQRWHESISTLVSEDYRPSFVHTYKYPVLRTIFIGFLNIPSRWIAQPIENLFDIGLPTLLTGSSRVHSIGPSLPKVALQPIEQVAQGVFYVNKYSYLQKPRIDEDLERLILKSAEGVAEKEAVKKAISDLNP